MRKRLRKKLHLKEFQQLGFSIHFTFSETLAEEALDAFLDYFIMEIIEKNKLTCGGGFYPEYVDVLACDRNHKSDTAKKKQLVKTALESNPLIKDFTLGELKDIWYNNPDRVQKQNK